MHSSLAYKSGFFNSRQSILTDPAHPGGCFVPLGKMRGYVLAAISAFLPPKSPLVIFSVLEDLPLPAPLSELKDQREQLQAVPFGFACETLAAFQSSELIDT